MKCKVFVWPDNLPDVIQENLSLKSIGFILHWTPSFLHSLTDSCCTSYISAPMTGTVASVLPRLNHFTALFPGPPGWASARKELLDFMEAETLTIQKGATPSGLSSAHLHHLC